MSGAGRQAAETAAVLALLLAAALVAHAKLVAPWVVVGRSMSPTLVPGDRVLVDRWTLGQRAPRIGEVVLLVEDGGVPMLKRIARAPAHQEGLWVLGDNAAESRDSRQFGPVARARVRGRVVGRYWPPSRVGRVR